MKSVKNSNADMVKAMIAPLWLRLYDSLSITSKVIGELQLLHERLESKDEPCSDSLHSEESASGDDVILQGQNQLSQSQTAHVVNLEGPNVSGQLVLSARNFARYTQWHLSESRRQKAQQQDGIEIDIEKSQYRAGQLESDSCELGMDDSTISPNASDQIPRTQDPEQAERSPERLSASVCSGSDLGFIDECNDSKSPQEENDAY